MDKEKAKRAEEARMLREAARVGTNAESAREIADDTQFGRLPTDWRPLDKPLDDEQARPAEEVVHLV